MEMSGRIDSNGYKQVYSPEMYAIGLETNVREHVVAATRVLGKRLPRGAGVHHVDFDKLNNNNDNLVICQDHAYHKLLHYRHRSMAATGDPHLVKCQVCGQWDNPDVMYVTTHRKWHRECRNEYLFFRKHGYHKNDNNSECLSTGD